MDFQLDATLPRLLSWHLVYKAGEDQGAGGDEVKWVAAVPAVVRLVLWCWRCWLGVLQCARACMLLC
jgi:hypothetical protein